MSAFLLGTGFRADMGTCIRKLVLLKLIDACEDDGTRIFPAIATVARAAQCSDRQVQREIKAFLDIGLLSLVRAGGQGRRSTNEYALDLDVLSAISKAGWDAYATGKGITIKGDTQSPLDDGAKGDKTGPDRVTPETPKGDNGSPPTPPDPSLDPSIERERGREDGQEETENRKSVERAFEKAYRAWPTSIADSRPEALKAWLALASDERELAAAEAERYVEAAKAAGRKHIVAHSVYLREKRWEQLPSREIAEKPTHVDAPAFGPLWQAARLKQLVTGAKAVPAGLTAFETQLVADGKASAEALHREKQLRSGWPAVNRMHELAEQRKGVTAATALEPLAEMMEPVPVASERFEEWRLEHARRGWPWLPDPGKQPVVYFPAGGPGALSDFEAAVRGTRDDAGGREAAE